MIRGAVLGSPITHSLSPVLHRSIFESLKLEGTYEAIEVRSGELQNFLESRSADFDYLSLTMPLKEEIVSLQIPQSSDVLKSQSGNTLIKRDGKWRSLSTDGLGFLNALADIAFTNFDNVLVLGAGGTARAICASLDGVAKKITVLGRTRSRKEALEQIVTHSHFTYEGWMDSFDTSSYSLVVNTTPSGAADLLAENVKDVATSLLFDVIYKPWPTKLATRWSDLGGATVSGLELLLFQGIAQIESVLEKDIQSAELIIDLRRKLYEASR